MEEKDEYTVPSREELKGLMARGAAEDLGPEEDLWSEVRYDQGKIDSAFESYEAGEDEDLDIHSGKPVTDIPEEAQMALSTAISYTSRYLDSGDSIPADRSEASEEFNELIDISASIRGMAPAAAHKLSSEEHRELFGENSPN